MFRKILFLFILLPNIQARFITTTGASYHRPIYGANVQINSGIELTLAQKIDNAKKFFEYKSIKEDLIILNKLLVKVKKSKTTKRFKAKKKICDVSSILTISFAVANFIKYSVKYLDSKRHTEDEAFAHTLLIGISILLLKVIEYIKKQFIYHGVEFLFIDISRQGWNGKDTKSVVRELEVMASEDPNALWVNNFKLYLDCYNNYLKLDLSI